MAQNNSGNNSSDQEMFFLILVCIGVLMVVVLFYYFLPYLKGFWVPYVKLEGYLTLYTTFDDSVKFQALKLIEWANEVNPENLDYKMFNNIRYGIIAKGGHNYIFIFLLLPMALYSASRWSQYKGLPGIHSLLKTEHRVWPTLLFLKGFDPNKEWSELRGTGRYMLSPFSFCVENSILKNYKADSAADRIYDDAKAEEVYSNSLGKHFNSYAELDGLEQLVVLHCLAAELSSKKNDLMHEVIKFSASYFVKKKNKDTEVRQYWKDHLTTSIMSLLDGNKYSRSNIPIVNSIIDAAIKQDLEIKKVRQENPYSKSKSILEFMASVKQKHAYASTLLIASIRYVKRLGKFLSGRFVYLKAFDRKLFLIINATPYAVEEDPHIFVSGFGAEIIGCFSHYQHETYAGRRLDEPFVGTAVTSIKARLTTQNLIRG